MGGGGGGGVMILLSSNLGAISVDNVSTPYIFNIIADVWFTFCFGKDNYFVGVIYIDRLMMTKLFKKYF